MVKAVENAHETWQVNLCSTCFSVPKHWCLACFCPPCFAFCQRKRILGGDMTKYRCCGGACCDIPTQSCPSFCLCLEVVFCFWIAIGVSRQMIKGTFGIMNTAMENCMITMACVCSWILCIVRLFINIPLEAEMLIDLIYCMFAACLMSQAEAELDYRIPVISKQPQRIEEEM